MYHFYELCNIIAESRASRKARGGGSQRGESERTGSADESSHAGSSSVASGSVGSRKRDKKSKKDFIKRNKEVWFCPVQLIFFQSLYYKDTVNMCESKSPKHLLTLFRLCILCNICKERFFPNLNKE